MRYTLLQNVNILQVSITIYRKKYKWDPTNLVAGFKHQFNLVVSFFTIASLASIPWHFWAWLLYLFTEHVPYATECDYLS